MKIFLDEEISGRVFIIVPRIFPGGILGTIPEIKWG